MPSWSCRRVQAVSTASILFPDRIAYRREAAQERWSKQKGRGFARHRDQKAELIAGRAGYYGNLNLIVISVRMATGLPFNR